MFSFAHLLFEVYKHNRVSSHLHTNTPLLVSRSYLTATVPIHAEETFHYLQQIAQVPRSGL